MRSSRLTVEREGVLTLPAAVCEALSLQPGDVLAIERLSVSFTLEVYREILIPRDFLHSSARWGFVARFLSRPLTALEPEGIIPIPQEVFPLPPGTELTLDVSFDGCGHTLHFF
ncbi:MAG TPA: AbrB/MazE/SpoVT family DNA-binding domain-containing protein [Thermoanaerobaculia bacterium]|nr:AbrB/MazE/SpoVT family DNA-binding domain-containing protein [Thermoanaerobaculia bacterium]